MEPEDDAADGGGACGASESFCFAATRAPLAVGAASTSAAAADERDSRRGSGCSASHSPAGWGGDGMVPADGAATRLGRAAGQRPGRARDATALLALPALLLLLLCAPGAGAFSGPAFAAAPVLSQPLVNVFQVDVSPSQPLPDVLQRVYLELWSDASGASGFNVTLFDDATKSVSGVVTTYLPVSRAWLDGVWARGERAFVRAHAFAADAPSPPCKPYQIAQSNKLAVAASTPWDAGDPFNGTAKGQLIAGCRVSE